MGIVVTRTNRVNNDTIVQVRKSTRTKKPATPKAKAKPKAKPKGKPKAKASPKAKKDATPKKREKKVFEKPGQKQATPDEVCLFTDRAYANTYFM
jgi:hypothetical protein